MCRGSHADTQRDAPSNPSERISSCLRSSAHAPHRRTTASKTLGGIGCNILPKNLSLRFDAVNKQNYQVDSSTSTRRSTLRLLIGFSPQDELHQLPNIVDLHLAHDLRAVSLNS